MLQTVYKDFGTIQASSLYCVWVCHGPGSRLEAIWIDREMREFEKQIVHEPHIKTPVENAPEEAVEELNESQAAE
jgi:hypothetical protein